MAPTGVDEGDGETCAEAHHGRDSGGENHAPKTAEEPHGGQGWKDDEGRDQHRAHHPHAQHNGESCQNRQQRIVATHP